MKVMLWSDRPVNKLCILVTRSGLFVKLKSISVLVWVVLVGLVILWCDLYLDAIILSFFLFCYPTNVYSNLCFRQPFVRWKVLVLSLISRKIVGKTWFLSGFEPDYNDLFKHLWMSLKTLFVPDHDFKVKIMASDRKTFCTIRFGNIRQGKASLFI